jgi:tRNA 2-thiocytidine biosynthesis protein TtcA
MPYAAKEIIRLTGRAIHDYRMIESGDRVIVGLSGGKDSLILLQHLARRLERIPVDYTLIAVHLDMGYEDDQQRKLLEDYVKALGVATHFEVTDFALRAHAPENRENPCFLCARRRRQRLFEIAREYGCTKIALGHHRDDLIETLLMNIIYSGEIATMLPVQEFFGGLLTIIRPLCMVPEDIVKRVAEDYVLPVVVNECPSAERSKRREIKDIIDRLAKKNDKVKGNIFRSLSNYRPDYLLQPTPRRRRKLRHLRKVRDVVTNHDRERQPMEDDQRKRTRVHFKAMVNLIAGGRELKGLKSRDLSLKGVFVETEQPLPLGTSVDVGLDLSGSTSTVLLKMTGKVARVDGKGMGIDFVEVDLDSFFHLRNIIKYNAGDPAVVDDELATKPAF